MSERGFRIRTRCFDEVEFRTTLVKQWYQDHSIIGFLRLGVNTRFQNRSRERNPWRGGGFMGFGVLGWKGRMCAVCDVGSGG